VVVDTSGSTFSTVLAVYQGMNLSSLLPVAANCWWGHSAVSFSTVAGTQYQIAVDGYHGQAGIVTLNLAAVTVPPNDAFASATVLNGVSIVIDASNRHATREAGEPTHAGVLGRASVWWKWTAPADGTVEFNGLTSHAGDSLVASLYTGEAVTNLNSIGGRGFRSLLEARVPAGQTVHLAVDSVGTSLFRAAFPRSYGSRFGRKRRLREPNGDHRRLAEGDEQQPRHGREPNEPNHAGRVGTIRCGVMDGSHLGYGNAEFTSGHWFGVYLGTP